MNQEAEFQEPEAPLDEGQSAEAERQTAASINEAQDRIRRAKRSSGWIFLATWVALSVASVLAIAALGKWQIIEDIRNGSLGAQFTVYREMLLAIVASAATAKVFAQHFVISADSKSVEQIVRTSQVLKERVVHYRTIIERPPGEIDPRFTDALNGLNSEVRVLGARLDADPNLKAQLTDFLSYARDQKIRQQEAEIAALKDQLAKDAEIFIGFRVALSQTAMECDRAAQNSKLRSA